MDIKKAPIVNLNATLNRILLMIIAIVIGILVSYNTADASVKIGKHPQTIQKKKNRTYSCEELSKKRRNSSNIVVKVKQRRPKWR